MVGDDGTELSEAEANVFTSNERRRCLVRLLLEEGEQPLSRVVDAIVFETCEVPPEEVSERSYRDVRVALGHTDIPRLSAGGVLEYDYADEVVSPGGRLDELAPRV